ncbi:MAG: family 78 glycoside hydrolase catalytic domain [Verrucomicrobiota bacterium]
MTRSLTLFALFAVCLLLGAAGCCLRAPVAAMQPTELRCEYSEEPLGVDSPQPRLSWVLQSAQRGEVQTRFQLLAASSLENLAKNQGDLWDSGQVKSAQTVNVSYAGRPLRSAQQVFWKVRAWDKAGQPSAWSAPASWTMGLLQEADWQAHWIGAAGAEPTLLLRREFAVKPGLRRAVVFVCGLGYYEMTINGGKVTDDLLTPGWSKYNKTCLYDTWDVTKSLRPGRNAIGLFLGNGMYNVQRVPGRYTKFSGSFGPQKAIAQLRLEFQDGSSQIVATDDQWRAAPGPITFTSAYGGEDYDARLDPAGWDQPGFETANWTPARMTNGPGGTLKGLSCAAPPIRGFDVFKPVHTTELKPGVTVYDFGQNAAQMPAITVHGPPGSMVKLWPSELVKSDGSADQSSMGRPTYCLYTLAGRGKETWSPRFFYCGYRWLQIECLAPPEGGALPVLDAVESRAVHSSSPPVGEFTTSNVLFNRIYALIRWAQRSNMASILTDCPHREKLGWLEQAHLNGPALRYNFDLSALFAKNMNDMADSQRPGGMVPTTAPEYAFFSGDFLDSPEWGSALPLVAWQQYEFTGDTELLRRYYDNMARWAAYLGSKARDRIVSYGLSDWYDIGPGSPGVSKLTPKGVTATAFYYQDTLVLAQSARLLGHAGDAVKYEQEAEQIRAAFNAKFYDPAAHQYATGSQCANSLALVMGLAPPPERAAILENVVRDVQKNGLTAGDVGYRYLLRALADGGRSDVIYAMNNQSEKPGYGLQLARGATSLTEAWDANPGSSQNHFMLGQLNEWFFHDLAGIQSDPRAPGFARILIKPALPGDLTFVKAAYNSIHGRISSEWRREGRRVTLNAAIPANTTATIYVPAAAADAVTESGRPAASVPGVKFLRMEAGAAVYEVGSGAWQFASETP